MHGLNEKHLLKQTFKEIVPADVVNRPKQPYRAPDADSFFSGDSGRARGDYIEDLLDPSSIAKHGIFRADAVKRLTDKARHGKVTSTKDNMALVGILSTQLLAHEFLPASAPQPTAQENHSKTNPPSAATDTFPIRP